MSKGVWNEMDKIVGAELLPSQQEINEKAVPVLAFEEEPEEDHVTDEREKLHWGDAITTGLCYCIAQSVYPSKRKGFALHALEQEESEYDQISAEMIGAGYRNYKVIFGNDLYFKEI